MERYMNAPLTDEDAKSLHSGDYVYITGTIYTARDAAHLRMCEALDRNETLPLELAHNIIYYMTLSCEGGTPHWFRGPTTASRMDKYTPRLLDLGLKGMIGKGKRSDAVREAIVRNGAVYFAAVGGAGALLSKSIIASEVVAYDDLGTEATAGSKWRTFLSLWLLTQRGTTFTKLLSGSSEQYSERMPVP